MLRRRSVGFWQTCTLLVILIGVSSAAAWAANPKAPTTFLDNKAFFKPELYISSSHESLDDLLPQLANRDAWQRFLARRQSAAGGVKLEVYLDPRSGAVTNLIGPIPMIPGRGVGNQVTLATLRQRLGRQVRAVDAGVVVDTFLAFAKENGTVLGIDRPARAAHGDPGRRQPLAGVGLASGRRRPGARRAAGGDHQPRQPGRDGHRDLGQRLDRRDAQHPAEEALKLGFAYAEGRAAEDVMVREPRLEIIPFAPPELQVGEAFAGPMGRGYGHRLVWTLRLPARRPRIARWEVLVDAHSGEVLAFEDTNHYVQQADHGRRLPADQHRHLPDAGHAAARCRPAGRCPSPTPASPRPTTSRTAPASSTTRAAP